jgi:hypothetical protein
MPKRLRDDRLFFIACDDTFAPEQYFNLFRLPRIQISVISTKDGTSHARHVLKRLIEFSANRFAENDERWMVLDLDHLAGPNHIKGLVSALRSARKLGVKIAISRPCFEIWLLLHHEDEQAIEHLLTARQVEKELRSRLGEYNKTNLKAEHYPYTAVVLATERARRLDQCVKGGIIPKSNTTRIYKILDSIGVNALASQFPIELGELLSKSAEIVSPALPHSILRDGLG